MQIDTNRDDRYKTLIEGYVQMDRIVLRLSSMYPEDPNVWCGTVPERLAYILDKMGIGGDFKFESLLGR
jgi:hypothetical protein